MLSQFLKLSPISKCPSSGSTRDELLGRVTHSVEYKVYGHRMAVDRVLKGRRVAMVTFSELCSEALGAADYIDLAERFQIIFLTEVPQISLKDGRNELRRLITLVDALYEGGTQLIVQAETIPTRLFEISAEEKAKSVHDEVFAFDRTVSRLLEMQSLPYKTGAALKRPLGASFVRRLVTSDALGGSEGNDVQEKDDGPKELNIELLLEEGAINKLWQHYNVLASESADSDTDIDVDCVLVFLDDLRKTFPALVESRELCGLFTGEIEV